MRSLAVVHALALALGLAGLAEAIITDSSRFMGYAIEPGGKTETWYCPTHLTSFVQSANFAECCATVANCGILTSCHQGSTLFNDRGYYLNCRCESILFYSNMASTQSPVFTALHCPSGYYQGRTLYLGLESQPTSSATSSASKATSGASPKQPATSTSSASSSSSSSPSSSTSPSRAWIAGAVIGPVIGVALVAAAAYALGRHRRRHRDGLRQHPTPVEPDASSPSWSPGAAWAIKERAVVRPASFSSPEQPAELEVPGLHQSGCPQELDAPHNQSVELDATADAGTGTGPAEGLSPHGERL